MRLASALAALALLPLVGGASERPFPLETLPPELRPRAEEMLLRALDTEALFTIVSGMKPMSTGFYRARFNVESPDLSRIDEARRILATFRNGDEIFAHVQPFWRIFDGSRYVEGVIYHAPSVRETVARHASFFAFYGISAHSHPVEVVLSFEVDRTARRNRGYGYLFGYPKHAVDFFVRAEEQRRLTNELAPRDFLQIPTHLYARGRFVYAVPRGHVPNEYDLAIQRRAEPILAYYRHIRPQYIGEGRPGVVQMLRNWFRDSQGRYSSAEAERKAVEWFRANPPAQPQAEVATPAYR